ncbi:hypothetical protein FACS18948_2900 [Clostridia bacterium]|nr:hypothetical protein FACS18948_2900 [Clostridia bacterium]
MSYTVRQATVDDIRPALDLALMVFMEYEASDYEPEGAVNFKSDIEWKAANLHLYLSGERLMFVAVADEKIVGVIESNRPEHINMVFVDGDYHRQGIATAMMEQMVCALKLRGSNDITINASPYGLPFFLHFGFVSTDSEQRKDGYVFTPMIYTLGEIWDVYDENSNLTGRHIERGRPWHEGDYHLAAFIYLLRADGRFLITKRSPNKETFPNMWEFPHGAVLAGETTLDAAIRECFEECGLTLKRDKSELIDTYKGGNLFSDHYLFRQDFDIVDITLQPGETCDAKAVTGDELREMVAAGQLQWYYLDYVEALEKAGVI